ncbi:tRNA (uracil-5-)-methyltransferase homolog A isoform X3 [Octopus sinensis]|uniref:tRNA (uracil(54)-C(5))-methyltransferase n=1 Tax=Octopus sinensis TaxID=2607531 RepID=A0A7E6FQI6_9MOLL|nr:tRNA (uracil-5-)-methyltransferase homolog A isoform X3 [Octopus sinensis]
MEVSAEKEANNDAIGSVGSSVGNSHDGSLTTETGVERIKNGNELVACEEKLADNEDSTVAECTISPDVPMTDEESKPTESPKCDQHVNSKKTSVIQDEYSYIKRDEFTSEIFKIEIQNLPRFGFSELKRKLVNLDLNPIKVKGFPHKGFAFVTFRDEEAREKALNILNRFQWKGHDVTAKKSHPTADPLVLKRKSFGLTNDEPSAKKFKESEDLVDANDELTPDERVRKAVMPLYDLTYEEQLKRKFDDIKNVMKRWTKELLQNCPDLKTWIYEQKRLYSDSICEILAIQPSPLLTGYRNKSEFTIGTNHEGSEKIVGFRLGSYRDGSSAVGEPSLCAILPEAMKKVAKEEIQAEKEALKEFFSEGEGKVCGVTSLFFNCVTKKQSSCRQAANYEHLMGNEWITENLLGLNFQISPDAFFQINNPATALLYSLVADWCQLEKDSVVLDICCGTGTIGLTLAKHVRRVLGVEVCPAAIEDAKKNAKLNDIKNIEFHCSRAEEAAEKLRNWSRGQKAVAIVDPPRPGLQPRVMYALRRCHFIHRVIYISCNPVAAIQNFTDLMRPKSRRNKGEPFFAVKAIPVDLFPHTKHCELVVMFERKQEPEAVQEPEKVCEPEAVQEPEKVCEPEAVQEPEKVCEPEAVPEPKQVCEPVKVCEPEAVNEPEKVCEPKQVCETEVVCKPDNSDCEVAMQS